MFIRIVIVLFIFASCLIISDIRSWLRGFFPCEITSDLKGFFPCEVTSAYDDLYGGECV